MHYRPPRSQKSGKTASLNESVSFSTVENSFYLATIEESTTLNAVPLYDSQEISPERTATLNKIRLKQRQRKWDLFRDSMKNTIPKNSPGIMYSSTPFTLIFWGVELKTFGFR